MSDQELYEIAQQRIDSRNRRWTFWTINLAGMIAYIGFFILIADSAFSNLGVAVLLAWIGGFVLHTILLGMAESRPNDIEDELTKMRQQSYEKPKRLQLAEDGELVEIEAEDHLYRDNSR